MAKKIQYAIVSLLLCCVSTTVMAMLKFDAAGTAGNVVKKASTIAQKAQETTAGVLEKANGAFFQNFMGEFNKLKTMATNAAGTVSGAVSQVQGAVGQVQGAVGDVQGAIGQVQSSVGQVAGQVQGAVGQVQGVINNAQSAVTDATEAASSMASGLANSQAVELAAMQKEQASAKQKYNLDIEDLQRTRDLEIKKYQDNIDTLKEMEAQDGAQYSKQMLEAQSAIKDIETKYQGLIDERQKSFDLENAAYADQIKELTSAVGALTDITGLNSGNLMSNVSGMLSGGGSGSVQDGIIAGNFYGKDEVEGSTRNAQIVAYRQKVALEDTADVYYQAVNVMRQGETPVTAVEDLRSKASSTETLPAGMALDIEMKIEQMKMLLDYARLMIAEMKVATAQDMLSLPKHLDNYDIDPSSFSLDDYKVKK